jgi:hypothetical protein
MRSGRTITVLTLIVAAALAPLFITSAHAIQGCQPTTPQPTCYLYAQTNVPSAEGSVIVRQDGNNALEYPLPHLFAFTNGTTHSIEVLTLTIGSTPSGARYLWDSKAAWTWHTLQYPNANMTTPLMIYNYTLPNDEFTAIFDKQFQYTLTFKDASGQTLAPTPTSVVLSSSGSTISTSAYSGQWISAGAWTVTSVTWEGYAGALLAPVPLDLTSASASVAVAVSAYSASVKVVDKLNNPISGVSMTVTFANTTSRVFTTDSQGTVQLGDIPVGPYSAHVFYQGQDQGTWSEDASAASISTVTLNIGGTTSAPVVSAIVLLTIFGVALFLILLAIKVRKPPPPPRI